MALKTRIALATLGLLPFIPILKEYAKWFGLIVGLLFYAYGIFILSGYVYRCECEAINMASYMMNHIDSRCLRADTYNYDQDAMRAAAGVPDNSTPNDLLNREFDDITSEAYQ